MCGLCLKVGGGRRRLSEYIVVGIIYEEKERQLEDNYGWIGVRSKRAILISL